MIKSSVLGVCKKNTTSRRWRMEKREREVEIIDASYPESPAAGVGCPLCFLCLSLVLFPPFFFLPSISPSSAVSTRLTHSLLCLHSYPTFFFSRFTLLLFTFHTPSVMLLPHVYFLCLQHLCLSLLIPPTFFLFCFSGSFFSWATFFVPPFSSIVNCQTTGTNNSESTNQYFYIAKSKLQSALQRQELKQEFKLK